MIAYFSTPSLLRNATPRKGNCGDFGVRKYDDGIGRFTSIDPLFEKYPGWTPYQYSLNNPVNLFDDNGCEPQSKAETNPDYYQNVTTISGESVFKAAIQPIDDAKVAVMNLANRLTLGTFNIQPTGLDGDLKTSSEITNASMNTLAYVGLMVLGGEIQSLRSVEQATKNVEGLIKSSGDLTKLRSGALQGTIKGNANKIFCDLTKDATKLKSGAFELKDGTIVNIHPSKKTGEATIDINKVGKLYKIRVNE